MCACVFLMQGCTYAPSNAHTFKLNRSLMISPFRVHVFWRARVRGAQSILHSAACNQGFLALEILILISCVRFRKEQAVELHLNDWEDLNVFFSNLPFI